MNCKRWEIYFALVPHEDDPLVKERHPILVINSQKAFILSYAMTSTNRGSIGTEYQLQYWKEAGLDHQTSVRLHRIIKIPPKDIESYVGELQLADQFRIMRKLQDMR